MKFLLTIAIIFFALFAISSADDCEVNGHVFNIGEKYTSGEDCIELTCKSKDSLILKTCKIDYYAEPCAKIDPTKQYPDCCPKYTC